MTYKSDDFIPDSYYQFNLKDTTHDNLNLIADLLNIFLHK